MIHGIRYARYTSHEGNAFRKGGKGEGLHQRSASARPTLKGAKFTLNLDV